jgi:hypothetical protein
MERTFPGYAHRYVSRCLPRRRRHVRSIRILAGGWFAAALSRPTHLTQRAIRLGSLGLTRALLRRGLELGGWWPYLLALADALAAAGIITLLTVVCVLGVQTFDDLAVFSGSDKARVLPLPELFDGIEAHPAAPEFWWVYALLLSTMIPSFVNLMIGGASLVRGIPWVTKLLLLLMPDLSPTSRGKVPPHNQQWITTLLTAQVCVGAAVGIAAQVLLAYVVIGEVLPLFGLDLLDLARCCGTGCARKGD